MKRKNEIICAIIMLIIALAVGFEFFDKWLGIVCLTFMSILFLVYPMLK